MKYKDFGRDLRMARIKFFPLALPLGYIAKNYRRERRWWGRLLNDIEHWLINRIVGRK